MIAIAAARLGWAPVVAYDHEAVRVEAAAANADANGVELELRARQPAREPCRPAPTVTANITAPMLKAIAERLGAPPRRLVCSGLLGPEVDGVASAFAPHGLFERGGRTDGDWNALLPALA